MWKKFLERVLEIVQNSDYLKHEDNFDSWLESEFKKHGWRYPDTDAVFKHGESGGIWETIMEGILLEGVEHLKNVIDCPFWDNAYRELLLDYIRSEFNKEGGRKFDYEPEAIMFMNSVLRGPEFKRLLWSIYKHSTIYMFTGLLTIDELNKFAKEFTK